MFLNPPSVASERCEAAPALAAQFAIIDELYDELLAHHGLCIGLRHARKHLGWALDAAAESAGAPPELLRAERQRVLRAENPTLVRHHLADAFDAFGAWQRAAA